MGQVWKQNRRITLQLLRDHGFGKSCMQEMIQAECVELAKSIRSFIFQFIFHLFLLKEKLDCYCDE